jgi:hypothetical protein
MPHFPGLIAEEEDFPTPTPTPTRQFFFTFFVSEQGCQIFLGTTYQNGKKYVYQMTTKYTKQF